MTSRNLPYCNYISSAFSLWEPEHRWYITTWCDLLFPVYMAQCCLKSAGGTCSHHLWLQSTINGSGAHNLCALCLRLTANAILIPYYIVVPSKLTNANLTLKHYNTQYFCVSCLRDGHKKKEKQIKKKMWAENDGTSNVSFALLWLQNLAETECVFTFY